MPHGLVALVDWAFDAGKEDLKIVSTHDLRSAYEAGALSISLGAQMAKLPLAPPRYTSL